MQRNHAQAMGTALYRVCCRRAEQLELSKVGLGLCELREEALLGLELARVDAAAPGFHADWVLQVQHLVVEQVFDCAARCVGGVEDAADDDGVVRGIVMAEHAPGVVRAPGQDGLAQETVEETRVRGVEDLVEVEVVANGA